MDVAEDKKRLLVQLFPETITETLSEDGSVVRAVDFEKLKAVLGTFSEVLEGQKERYGMTWPGKNECLKIIQQPSIATLKPCREESVNFDETENIFIEGDNLEVLKLLQKAYYGKVKMIYIDPPYNTGKEFIYPDKFAENLETYLAYTGQVDAEGRKFSTNTEAEGRFHSKWLNMMLPRLYLARNLLREDGVIFISIDDCEASRLLNLCDEIFGEECRLATIVWHNSSRNSRQIAIEHEYVAVYGKVPSANDSDWSRTRETAERLCALVKKFKREKKSPEEALRALNVEINALLEEDTHKGTKDNAWLGNYRNIDENWELYYPVDLSGEGAGPSRKFGDKEIPAPPGRHWMSQEYIDELMADNRIVWRGDRAYRKLYIQESMDNLKSVIRLPTRNGSEMLKQLLGRDIFDKPKPHNFVEHLIHYVVFGNDIVLDFFSGSCTTAHAVLDLNKQDGGTRNFIMVQLPELCEEKSEAYKAGYKTIADIGKERIRRVIKKLNDEESGELNLEGDKKPDRGFCVFKLDRSNFKVWDSEQAAKDPTALAKQLELHEQHIIKEATSEDILYELLLKAGFPLTTKVEKQEMAGKEVFSIEGGTLLICLERELTKELIKAMSDASPSQVICLDEGFKGNDQLKANAVQTFKAHAQGKGKEAGIVFRTV